jgi:hypothetical protein
MLMEATGISLAYIISHENPRRRSGYRQASRPDSLERTKNSRRAKREERKSLPFALDVCFIMRLCKSRSAVADARPRNGSREIVNQGMLLPPQAREGGEEKAGAMATVTM